MPLFDHLAELRRRVTIIAVSLLVSSVIIYFATPTLIDIMTDPLREALDGSQLTILTALGGFTIRFKVAMFFGVIVCTPIIIWETLGFFLPALKPSEQRWVVPTVLALVGLFFLGMVFCYFVIQRAAFGWLLEQTAGTFQSIPDAEDYLNVFMLLEIGFGIAFELPLVIFYLSILHIVTYATFRSQWRYIYVGLLTLSAITTPDASPVTMVLMFGALIALYEVALVAARLIIVARDGKEALRWTREDYEDHELENA